MGGAVDGLREVFDAVNFAGPFGPGARDFDHFAPEDRLFEHEPAVDKRLLRLAEKGKAVMLPHMGSATIEGRIDMGEKVIINIRTWCDGHRPPDRVLPPRT